MCREYNGWKNYPTWCVNVHGILDARGDLEEIGRAAYEEHEGKPHYNRMRAAVHAVGDALRNELQEAEEYAQERGLPAMLQDVLGFALESIDVDALAVHLVADTPGLEDATPALAGEK